MARVITRTIEIIGIEDLKLAADNTELLAESIERLDKILAGSKLGTEKFTKLAGTLTTLNNSNAKTEQSFRGVADAADKAGTEFKTLEQEASALKREISKLENQKLTIGLDPTEEARLTTLRQELTKVVGQQQKSRAEQRLLNNEFLATGQAGVGTYRALSAQLNANRARLKDLLVLESQGIKLTKQQADETKRLTALVQSQDNALKKVDATTGQYQRSVGNYSKAISGFSKQLIGAFGIVGGVQLFANAVRGAASTVVEFDQSTANLRSITQATNEELSLLTNQALELGATTAFSATQVLELQTELAKLGFSTQEILQSTEAIENFSIAVGTDAASAAALAGAAVRSFAKDASETEDVVSTLAVATTKSALDFSKLQTALPVVGATANAAGVSIEKLTAQLGVAADRGIDASTSATSLRNIFLTLASEGITYEDALSRINNSTNKLAEANDLFGKRGANVALILAENASQVDTLEESITGANETLQIMTDQRLDTLEGSLTLASSAWQGFVLSVESGDGIISRSITSVVDGFSKVLNTLTEINNGNFSQVLTFGIDGLAEAREDLKEYEQGLIDAIDTQSELDSATDNGLFQGLVEDYKRTTNSIEEAEEKAFAFLETLRSNIETNNQLAESRKELLSLNVTEIADQKELNSTLGELRSFKGQLLLEDQEDLEVKKQLFQVNNQINQTSKALAKSFETETEAKKESTKSTTKQLTEIGKLNKVISDNKKLLEGNLSTNQIKEALEEIAEAEGSIQAIKDNVEEVRKSLEGDTDSDILNQIAELEGLNISSGDGFNPVSEEAVLRISELKEQLKDLRESELEDLQEGLGGLSGQELASELEEIAKKKGEISLLTFEIDNLNSSLENISDIDVGDIFTIESNSLEGITKAIDEALKVGDIDLANSLVGDLDRLEIPLDVEASIDQDKVIAEYNNKVLSAQFERLPVTPEIVDEEIFDQYKNTIDKLIEDGNTELASKLFSDLEDKGLGDNFEDLVANYKTNVLDKIAEEEQRQRDEALKLEQEKLDKIVEITELSGQAIGTALNTLSTLSEARANKEISAINQRYEAELALAEGNEEAISEIEARRDAEIAEAQKKAFDRDKKLAIAQAGVDGALAVLKAFASLPPPFNFIQAGLVAAQTAAQVALISSTEFQAEKGALIKSDGTFVGNSHRDGGIKTIINGTPVEVEGKEQAVTDGSGAVMVMNKNARKHKSVIDYVQNSTLPVGIKRFLYSDINSSTGGVSFGNFNTTLPKKYGNAGTGIFAQDGALISSPSNNVSIQQNSKIEIDPSSINAMAETIGNKTAIEVGQRVQSAIYEANEQSRKLSELDSVR